MEKSNLLKKNNIIKLIFIAIIILILFRFMHFLKISHHHISVKNMIHFISSKGKYSFIFFLLIFSLKPFMVVIPSWALSMAGGVIFGSIQGFALSMFGFWLSGSLAFFLSRLLGKSFVDNILQGKILKIDDSIEKNGFKIMFLLRLPPILPFDIVSYAAGLTKVKYKDFVMGSLLGVIPETISYCFMGNGFRKASPTSIIIPIIITIIVTAITLYISKKKNIISNVQDE